MLTQQEIMNHAFKDLLLHEEMSAKKYADLAKEVKDPEMQKMFFEMEVAANTRYSTLTQKMNKFGIA